MSDVKAEEIQRLQKRITDLIASFPTIPRELSDDEKGERLLEAYMNDQPFDRHAFSFIAVKAAFLRAAFRTCDPEVIASCMFLVRQTLKDSAFTELINAVPQFKTTYEALTRLNNPLVQFRSMGESERLQTLKKELATTKSEIVKSVLTAEIQKIEKHDPWCGCLEVDKRWDIMVKAKAANEYTKFNPRELCKSGLFSRAWKNAVNPMQAAIVTKYWNMPCGIPNDFASLVTDKKEREVLVQRGVVPM